MRPWKRKVDRVFSVDPTTFRTALQNVRRQLFPADLSTRKEGRRIGHPDHSPQINARPDAGDGVTTHGERCDDNGTIGHQAQDAPHDTLATHANGDEACQRDGGNGAQGAEQRIDQARYANQADQ